MGNGQPRTSLRRRLQSAGGTPACFAGLPGRPCRGRRLFDDVDRNAATHANASPLPFPTGFNPSRRRGRAPLSQRAQSATCYIGRPDLVGPDLPRLGPHRAGLCHPAGLNSCPRSSPGLGLTRETCLGRGRRPRRGVARARRRRSSSPLAHLVVRLAETEIGQASGHDEGGDAMRTGPSGRAMSVKVPARGRVG